MNACLSQYQNTQVSTSSPEQLLVMLYDGAIRFVCQAQDALAAGKKKTKSEKISKTMAIICELANTLDHEVGGEIAENLDALYDFMVRELIKANLQNNRQSLEGVRVLLANLKAIWVQAIAMNQDNTVEMIGSKNQGEEKPAGIKPLPASL